MFAGGPKIIVTPLRAKSNQTRTPPPSALNVTLPAFAAERRRRCSAAPAAIDRYLLPAWRTAANPLTAAAPDMELGHWVTGSMGHLGHLSRPGHRVIILTRCETRVFTVLEKSPR